MPGRKILDAHDARRCLEAISRSGLTPRAWASVNGVDGRSLNAWRINQTRTDARALHVVELVATPHAPRAGRYVVRLGDVAVDLDEHVDEQVLATILRAVRSC
jgi:hypothetical protein